MPVTTEKETETLVWEADESERQVARYREATLRKSWDEALELARRLDMAAPGGALNQCRIAGCLTELHQHDEAERYWRDALCIEPGHPIAMTGLAVHLWRWEHRYNEAESMLRRAVELAPIYKEAHVALGELLVEAGQMAEGWQHLAWLVRTDYGCPVWDGGDARGKTLVVAGWGGYGDMIQFARYFGPILERGRPELLAAYPKSLRRLIERIPGVKCLEGTGKVQTVEVAADAVVELPLLPVIFGRIDPAPYLTADPVDAQGWAARLAGDRNFKVGLAWAGSPNTKHDRYRSMRLRDLADVLDVPGASFYSLQTDGSGQQVCEFLSIIDYTQELHDFAATAALMVNLDLVITIDSAVAHLAGALGVPVWNLLSTRPEFRWPRGHESRTIWYRSMRLCRQENLGDWRGPVRRVADDLRAMAESR